MDFAQDEAGPSGSMALVFSHDAKSRRMLLSKPLAPRALVLSRDSAMKSSDGVQGSTRSRRRAAPFASCSMSADASPSKTSLCALARVRLWGLPKLSRLLHNTTLQVQPRPQPRCLCSCWRQRQSQSHLLAVTDPQDSHRGARPRGTSLLAPPLVALWSWVSGLNPNEQCSNELALIEDAACNVHAGRCTSALPCAGMLPACRMHACSMQPRSVFPPDASMHVCCRAHTVPTHRRA